MQQEANHNQHYNDEIDLFELFGILWRGKFIIVTTVALSLLVGAAYVSLTPTIYKIEVPYRVQLHSVESQQFCIGNLNCLDKRTKNSINSLGIWVLIGSDQPNLEQITDRLKSANVSLTKAMRDQAQVEFDLINNQLPRDLLSTERVATNYLNAKRLLDKIATGIEAVEVREPKVTIISHKTSLILASSIVIGGLTGIFLVFFRKGLESYRKRLKE
jgi:LPS O-antigen subunit length determinant protein (WzzB/FepE family)